MLIDNKLPRSTPGEQGVKAAGIIDFLDAVEKEAQEKKSQELHSFMLIRHGFVVAEGWWSPYEAHKPHMLFSLSKSFTSSAIGFAVKEELIKLDDYVVSFFPEDVPETLSENLAAMRIRHLLSMSTGNAEDTMEYLFKEGDGNWVRGFFSVPVEYTPGTYFLYNTGATYMLSAIIQKITGQTLMEYLKPRLFDPLSIDGATWETCPRGINTGGFGLKIKTEDIAKFGQLYLQKGMWEGKCILPPEWIEKATTEQISNGAKDNSDWTQGYGFQFWRCRHEAYRGDGAFGQYCIVLPRYDAVVAITSGVDDMQVVLNLIWEHLLPAMSDSMVQVNDEIQAKLINELSKLELPIPKNSNYSSNIKEISENHYVFEENAFCFKDLIVSIDQDQCTLEVLSNSDQFIINCGIENWITGELLFNGNLESILASGTWKDDNTFVITLRLIETPFYHTVTFFFEDDNIHISIITNVSFGPKELPTIKGRRKN
jgi:CubicO group peptidase (beta-lactamase class C family)